MKPFLKGTGGPASEGGLLLLIMSNSLKIRPFREYIHRERDLPALEISGRIEGELFVACAVGYEISLDTATVGEDKWGAYALVKEHQRSLSNGLHVRVESEPDEDAPPGSVIKILLEGASPVVAEQLLRVHGLDLNSLDTTSQHVRGISVHFNPSGISNGTTSS